MLLLSNSLLAFTLALSAFDPMPCPPGTQAGGAAPPKGTAQWCEMKGPDGKMLRHGPYAEWHPSGDIKVEGFYLEGKPTGTWLHYRSGETLRWKEVEYDEQGNVKEDTEWGEDGAIWKGVLTWHHDNGKLKRELHLADGMKTGIYQEWHENGQLAVKGEFKDGLREGEWQEWFADGKMKKRESYAEGKRVGEFSEWYESGQLKQTAHWKNGQPEGNWITFGMGGNEISNDNYVNGCIPPAKRKARGPCLVTGKDGKSIKTGYWNGYYPSGDLQSEGWFCDGEKCGTWLLYSTGRLGGFLTKEEDYWQGEKQGIAKNMGVIGRGDSEGAYVDGQKHGHWVEREKWRGETLVAEEGDYEHGRRIGLWKFAVPDDRGIRREGEMDGESKTGPWKEWERDSYREVTYANDKREGLWQEWYWIDGAKGQLKSTGQYQNGMQTGEWKYWHPNGQMYETGGYSRDLRTGPWTEWSPEGKVAWSGTYVDGQRINRSSQIEPGKDMSAPSCVIPDLPEEAQAIAKNYHDDQGRAQGLFVGHPFPGQKEISATCYFNGKKNGMAKRWDNHGMLMTEFNYREDKKHGQSKAWYPAGKPQWSCGFVADRPDGNCTQWYDNGVIKTEAHFKEGVATGTWAYYRQDGSKWASGACNGTPEEDQRKRGIWVERCIRDGKWEAWDENSTLIYTGYFESGQIKKEEWKTRPSARVLPFYMDDLKRGGSEYFEMSGSTISPKNQSNK